MGFEPMVHETCTPVFETGTLNPLGHLSVKESAAKVYRNADYCKEGRQPGARLRIQAYVRVCEPGALAIHGLRNRHCQVPVPLKIGKDCLAGVPARHASHESSRPDSTTREIQPLQWRSIVIG